MKMRRAKRIKDKRFRPVISRSNVRLVQMPAMPAILLSGLP